MLNFQELYESHSAEVYKFALWLAGDAAEAEDITSETFVRAWARNKTIRTDTLKAYLFTIARNTFLERLRKGSRQVELNDVYPDPSPGPEALYQSRSQLEQIRPIIRALPEIDRSAFILRIQHELPYSEIAQVLEISGPAARVKVHRVRKRILLSILDEPVANLTDPEKEVS